MSDRPAPAPADSPDIAIIGVAGRFPGARNPQEFWANLAAGVESVTLLSDAQLDAAGVSRSRYSHPRYVKAASVLDDVDRFDAEFFSISPKEAALIDPQIRLSLECAWESLEDAGWAPQTFDGSIGVYAAASLNTYLLNQVRDHFNLKEFVLADDNLQRVLTNGHDFLATRISYKLGLRGPSFNVQSACSGALVAVHLARQSLLSGECDMALAGAASIYLPQDVGYLAKDGLILSHDGHCRPFDAAASGTIFGRGVGFVVLKPLARALDDADHIYAVIKGSAVNNDGRAKVGYTAPGLIGQAEVIAEAMADAGVSPDTIGYVEAHGTGTEQGDPVEIAGLTHAFRAQTARTGFCAIGSVKSNIGHLDAAAGIAALIKTVLALGHKKIPPTLNFTRGNPGIDFAASPFFVNTQLREWSTPDGTPRRAGVSAFGLGGTNAHVVVEEAPDTAAAVNAVERTQHVLTLSARSETALRALASSYGATLDGVLPDVCFTANAGRTAFNHRAAIAVGTPAEARAGLAAIAAGETPRRGRVGRVRADERPRMVWLFTGQGAQYAGMARQLYETQPTFRRALEKCDAGLRNKLTRPLIEVLYRDESGAVNETAYAQPALFAVEYALAELWRSWGLEPDAVLGHSIGEYAAACVAGVFSLDDALRLVAERGRLMQALPRGGAMAAVFADRARVAAAIESYAPQVSIAAINGPESSVISGDAGAVDAVCAALRTSGIESKPLTVSHAFHSRLMDPMLQQFESVARSVVYRPPQIPIVSTVTGRFASGDDLLSAEYWRRQARGTVEFASGVQTLAERHEIFVEIGPKATLISLGRRSVTDSRISWAASLRSDSDDWTSMSETAAALWVGGVSIDWTAFDRDYARRRVALPTYPFQRERYWLEPAGDASPARVASGVHPLLGERIDSPAFSGCVYETRLPRKDAASLSDHCVAGKPVLPLTAYLEMARAAFGGNGRAVVLGNLKLERALFVDEPQRIQTIVRPNHDSPLTFEMFSQRVCSEPGDTPTPAWHRHASGEFLTEPATVAEGAVDILHIQSKCTVVGGDEYFDTLRSRGLEYGLAFRGIKTLWRRDGEVLAEIANAADFVHDLTDTEWHPAFLDAFLQPVFAALPGSTSDALYLPVAVGRVVATHALRDARWSHVVLADGPADSERLTASIRIADASGMTLMTLSDVTLQRTSRSMLIGDETALVDNWLYEMDWRPKAADPGEPGMSDGRDHTDGISDAALERVRLAHGVDVYERLQQPIDVVCGEFAIAALTQLGWAPSVGEVTTTPELAARLAVLRSHERMLGRLLEMLAEDGILGFDGRAWRVLRPLPAVAPLEKSRQLLELYPECACEIRVTQRCGAHLADVLSGRQDPLELLFPGGSLADLETLYRDSPFARACNELITQAVSAAVAAARRDRPIRILEIGAGTGGTASWVMPALPADRVEYVFTDVSKLFLERAKRRFAAHQFVRYELLDIERNPAEQGFEGRTFDIVLATNVLHATADCRKTLEYVRALLKPDGLLAVVEGVARQRWIDVIFGLTDGWWRFADADLRPSYPLIGIAHWRALLEQVGFGSAQILPSEDRATALFHQAVIVAGPTAAPALRTAARRHWIICADATGVADRLATVLECAGDGVTLLDQSCEPDAFAASIREVEPAGAELRAAYLRALDAHENGDEATEALLACERRMLGGALQFVQALVADERWRSARLTFVTRGAQPIADLPVESPRQATVWGFARAAALEHPELGCRRIDVDPAGAIDLDALADELRTGSSDDEVGWRGGVRYVGKLSRLRMQRHGAPLSAPAEAGLAVEVATRGVLETVALHPVARRAPAAGEVEIQIHSAGLNFKDVLAAMGTLGDSSELGFECAGKVVRVGDGVETFRAGDEVVALASGSLASYLTTSAAHVFPKPRNLTFSEAASVPVAFMTAYYGLEHVANMRRGDRVLIHSATGGVGMAALQLAMRSSAEIFATAGSDAKRAWLQRSGVAHVFDSRTPLFVHEIQRLTNGRGVDIVLNSAVGDVARASFSILAPSGRFIELGKSGALDAADVARVRPDVAYTAIDVGQSFAAEPGRFGPMLADILRQLENAELKPLPVRRFRTSDLPEAFRLMAQARHMGKLVIDFADHSRITARTMVRPDGTYVITGGRGALGLLFARWLVDQGARHLVLVGRSGASAAARTAIEEFRSRGVRTVEVTGDVADPNVVRMALDATGHDMPPIRGVIHSAGVVEDRMIVHQDWRQFEKVSAAKILGSWNLHQETRALQLDFFVLFSTVMSLLGSAGQSNHAAANAYMDALASFRRRKGLPALSINWGPWAEIGAAAVLGVTGRLAKSGIDAIPTAQGVKAFEVLLPRAGADSTARSQAGVVPIVWPLYLNQATARQSARLSDFSGGRTIASPQRSDSNSATSVGLDIAASIQGSAAAERRTMLSRFVRAQIARSLGIGSADGVDPERAVIDLGLDSLLALEVRSTLAAAFGKSLPATLLFDYPTADRLAEYLGREVLAIEPWTTPDHAADTKSVSTTDALSSLEQLSDDEVERLLAERLGTTR